jgi:hypothetical protein
MFQQLMFQVFYEALENNLLTSYRLHCQAIEDVGDLTLYKNVSHYLMVTEAIYHRGLAANWKPMYTPN